MQNSKRLANKVAIISGASRGIGAATAIALAKNGCHVVIAGKTNTPNAKLEGTIHTTQKACDAYDVTAIAVKCDINYEADIDNLVTETIKTFGKIDILINAASISFLTDINDTSTEQFDMMYHVNVRGTYLMSKTCIPFLKLSGNGHIVNFAPPLVLNAQYFSKNLAYTMSKYNMSMCSLGMAHEFYHESVAVNSLWSRTLIKTASIDKTIPDKFMRKPTIMADAVIEIVSKPSKVCTGCFLIDDLVLAGAGITDFAQYAYDPKHPLLPNLFLPHDLPPLPTGVILHK